jgi:hypothetical protein
MADWDTGALLGGLFGFGSGIATNVANARQAEKQMRFQTAANQKQMQYQTAANKKQMDFQERMSGSAHQRQMADMKKAGLNPILSAKYGGASSPAGSTSGGATSGGAMAQMKDPSNSALSAMRFEQELKNTMAHTNTQYLTQDHLNTLINAQQGNVKYQQMLNQFLNTPRGKIWFETQQWLPQATSALGAAGGAIGLKRLKTLTKSKSGGKGFKPATFNKSTGEIR